MTKKFDLRKVERSKKYKVRELAELFKVTPRAIYHMIKEGLPVILLEVIKISGDEFIEFEKSRRIKRHCLLEEDEMYCLFCRKPQKVGVQKVQIQNFKKHKGNVVAGTLLLLAKCPECGKEMHKFSNKTQMDSIRKTFNI